MFVRASLHKRREENHLDATECFVALIICSTCFGHLHAHHQELETILVLLPHMVCNALVAGGRLLGAERQAMRPGWGNLHPGRIACCSSPNSRTPATNALHTICGNNTSIVSSSWWWAYKCPKHVVQIISAIKHSVAPSWFSSLRWNICVSSYCRLSDYSTHYPKLLNTEPAWSADEWRGSHNWHQQFFFFPFKSNFQ